MKHLELMTECQGSFLLLKSHLPPFTLHKPEVQKLSSWCSSGNLTSFQLTAAALMASGIEPLGLKNPLHIPWMLCLAIQTNRLYWPGPRRGLGLRTQSGGSSYSWHSRPISRKQTRLKEASEKPKEITQTYLYSKSSTTWVPLKRNLELLRSHNFSGYWAVKFKEVLFCTFPGYYSWLKLSMNIRYLKLFHF